MNGPISVRPATEQDVESILQLDRATDFAPHWAPEAYTEIVAAGLPARGVTNGRTRCLLVAVGVGGSSQAESVLGFAAGALLLREGRGAGLPAELESIAVSDAARRQGVGRALCQAVIRWAAAHGAESLELEVRAGNAAAVRLYGTLGFQANGLRPRYYSGPEEDALLMSVRLEQEIS